MVDELLIIKVDYKQLYSFKIKVEETNPIKIIDKRYKLIAKVIITLTVIAVITGIAAAVIVSQISKYFVYLKFIGTVVLQLIVHVVVKLKN